MTHSWSIKDVNEEVILDFEVCLLTCKLVAQLKWGYYWLLFHWPHLSIASQHHDQVFLLLLQMQWKLRTDMFVNYSLPGMLRWKYLVFMVNVCLVWSVFFTWSSLAFNKICKLYQAFFFHFFFHHTLYSQLSTLAQFTCILLWCLLQKR